MVKTLSILSPDPEAGYPPIHLWDDIPTIVRRANSRTTPTPQGELGLPPHEIAGRGGWNSIAG